ncbi:hypothetical protein BDP27DRAFT_1451991 [Rhodocollybia butyracea]|uniref:Uncharacterized protein n=1 Tax=Rhodocollybia butyracea TaxID=206335 RepID=A0A9P5PGW8_9AGAR|nr:hypothetical protein BDP27DRAFT_1451991 [Rhodocollybia butyracea]
MASSYSFEEHDDLLERSKGLIVACMWRSHCRLLAAGVPDLRSASAYVRVGAAIINSALINVVWLLSIFVTSNVSSVAYQMLDASYVCITGLIFSAVIVSASRPLSSESFQVTPMSFAREFPPYSMPSTDSLLSTNHMLEAGVQPAESSSLDRSDNEMSPKETV